MGEGDRLAGIRSKAVKAFPYAPACIVGVDISDWSWLIVEVDRLRTRIEELEQPCYCCRGDKWPGCDMPGCRCQRIDPDTKKALSPPASEEE